MLMIPFRLIRFNQLVAASMLWLASSVGVDAKDWAISGTILAPDNVISDGAVTISGEKIAAVGASKSVGSGVNVIKIDGIVLPGLIDLHNHLTWNILPRWVPNHSFANRYAWQVTAEYDRVLTTPHSIAMNAAACESEIYAEVKAIMGGATSVVGSLMPNNDNPNNRACSKGLARNLDIYSDLGFTGPTPSDPCQTDPNHPQTLLDFVDYEVFPMEVPSDRASFLRCTLKSGALHALVVHLSEGAPNDGSARREFRMLNATGLIQPGLVVVHGTALRGDDFQVLSKAHAGLVWSPRSNDELYGDTTNVAAAVQQGVSVAIAPDWSPTGSAGMLQELGYASRRTGLFNSTQLVSMVTSVPARLARLDDRIGSLVPGMFADMVVIRGNRSKPFDAVTQATPADVQLVVVGGRPIYGDPAIMAQLLPGSAIEHMEVCGVRKAINLADSAASDRKETFADIQKILRAALAKSGTELAPLECQ